MLRKKPLVPSSDVTLSDLLVNPLGQPSWSSMFLEQITVLSLEGALFVITSHLSALEDISCLLDLIERKKMCQNTRPEELRGSKHHQFFFF